MAYKWGVRCFNAATSGSGFCLVPDVDVAAHSAAPLFNHGEIGTLIPVGFGVVIVGDGVEARRVGRTAGDNGVGHANDG